MENVKPYSEQWPSKRSLFEGEDGHGALGRLAAVWHQRVAAMVNASIEASVERHIVGVDPGITSERMPERTVNHHARRAAARDSRRRADMKRGRRR